MYRVIRGFGYWLACRTPAQLDKMANTAAFLWFDMLRFRRRLIVRNLTIAFGDDLSAAERCRMGRASIRHLILTFFEFLQSVRMDPLRRLTVEGDEHAAAALQEGRGAYILCAHLGNWEIFGGTGERLMTTPVSGIVKEVGKGRLNYLVDELRRGCGWIPIYRKPAGEALRAIRAALKRNEFVAFMLDQARPGAPRIPFFGAPARTQTSLAAFARKYPAPVIPVCIRRLSPGRHHVHVWPALELPRSDDAEKDVLESTARFNRQIETMIRTAPEQYFWLHNRWK